MRVLVIEDFAPIRTSVVQSLREAGYAVDEAGDGEAGLWHARSNEHDVIILDLMLPRMDGFELLRKARREGCTARILILTARDQTADKVRGLDGGADDYLAKPFQMSELLARVHALVRRKYGTHQALLQIGDLEVDVGNRRVRRGGAHVDLSVREYSALEYLARNENRTVSRADIFHNIYDSEASLESNVIDVLVARIRSKLEAGGKGRLIFTRRGFGYLLTATPEQDL